MEIPIETNCNKAREEGLLSGINFALTKASFYLKAIGFTGVDEFITEIYRDIQNDIRSH